MLSYRHAGTWKVNASMDYFVDETFNKRFHVDKVMVEDVIRDNFKLWYGEDFFKSFSPQLDAQIGDYPNIITFKRLLSYQGPNESISNMRFFIQEIMRTADIGRLPGALEAITGCSFLDFIKDGYYDYNYFAFWQLFKMREYDLDVEEVFSQIVAGDIEIIILVEELLKYSGMLIANLRKEKYITKNNIQVILDIFDKLFSYSSMVSSDQVKQFMSERAILREMLVWIEEEFLSDTNIIPYSFLKRIASKEKSFSIEKMLNGFEEMRERLRYTEKTLKLALRNGLVFLPEISSVLAYYSTDDKKKDNLLVVYIQNILYEILAKYYQKYNWEKTDITIHNLGEHLNDREIKYYATQLILITLLHEYAHAVYKRVDFPRWKRTIHENKMKLTEYGNESIEEEYCEIFSHYWAAVLLNSKKDLEFYRKNLNPEIFKFIFAV
jgi:hypothetical protein